MLGNNCIEAVVRAGLCVSCGACVSTFGDKSGRMKLSNDGASLVPDLPTVLMQQQDSIGYQVCPGKGLPLKQLSDKLLGSAPNYSFELGYYVSLKAVRSTNPKILKLASSGGAMTELSNYLLAENIVDGVTAVKFDYGYLGPRPISYIAKNWHDLLASQGSKYCPTATNELVDRCYKNGGRFLFIGLPCQVGALRLAMERDISLRGIFPHVMTNFCGGFRDYRCLDFLCRRNGLTPAEVVDFRFRGQGHPGKMYARDQAGREINYPYPDYMRGCTIPKAKRCVFCVDATGELSDISFGDAWLERFKVRNEAWSLVICRTAFADELISNLVENGILISEPITEKEVVKSQQLNIISKKFRQYKRMRVAKMFGIKVPTWDVDLPKDGSYLEELRVFLGKGKQSLKEGFTRIVHG